MDDAFGHRALTDVARAIVANDLAKLYDVGTVIFGFSEALDFLLSSVRTDQMRKVGPG